MKRQLSLTRDRIKTARSLTLLHPLQIDQGREDLSPDISRGSFLVLSLLVGLRHRARPLAPALLLRLPLRPLHPGVLFSRTKEELINRAGRASVRNPSRHLLSLLLLASIAIQALCRHLIMKAEGGQGGVMAQVEREVVAAEGLETSRDNRDLFLVLEQGDNRRPHIDLELQT